MMSSEDSDLAFLTAALATMLDASDEGFIVLDGGGRCRMIARRAGEMFGVDPSAYIGKQGAEVLEAFAKACDDPDAFWRAAAAPLGAPVTAGEVDVRKPFARTVLCRAIAVARDTARDTPRTATREAAEGRLGGRIVFVRDVTLERAAESSTRQLRARLRALMPFDGLTGLLNQRRLYEELGREHSRSTRAWDSYTLLRIDVDGMKDINLELGLPSGDVVLEQVARRLETCVREYDVLARLEGDEFGVLLPGADAVAARAVGTRMVKAVGGESIVLGSGVGAAWSDEIVAVGGGGAAPVRRPSPPERTITISVGGALWMPPSRLSAEAIFRRSGDALWEARQRGGAQLHLYEPS
ncbi:MAG TPA: diguanylate cyclase [Polyangiaceae bacterium]|jgi:diguanylate cyclase (GGDEF)-like protein